MSASQELEKAATSYALDAVKMDKQGNKGRAITLYQKAIESLLAACSALPRIRFKQSLRAKSNRLPRTNQSPTGFRFAPGCPTRNGARSRGKRELKKPHLKAKTTAKNS